MLLVVMMKSPWVTQDKKYHSVQNKTDQKFRSRLILEEGGIQKTLIEIRLKIHVNFKLSLYLLADFIMRLTPFFCFNLTQIVVRKQKL